MSRGSDYETTQKPPFNQIGIYELKPSEQTNAMKSGCIFLIEMLDKIGLFRVDYFIDKIDNDIRLRAKRNGYKFKCILDVS